MKVNFSGKCNLSVSNTLIGLELYRYPDRIALPAIN